MAKVSAAKVPSKRASRRELYATVCWYYPRYSLQEAQKLPGRDAHLLIRIAQKREAIKFYNLSIIASASRATKGNGMRKVIDHFKKLADI